MNNSFKNKINKNFDHWKFTGDGRFPRCAKKYKRLRRRNQRAIEKRDLNRIIDKTL